MPVQKPENLSVGEKIRIFKEAYTSDWDRERVEQRMLKMHKVFSEVQARNEARGYEYGWVNGQFVVTKYPENQSSTN